MITHPDRPRDYQYGPWEGISRREPSKTLCCCCCCLGPRMAHYRTASSAWNASRKVGREERMDKWTGQVSIDRLGPRRNDHLLPHWLDSRVQLTCREITFLSINDQPSTGEAWTWVSLRQRSGCIRHMGVATTPVAAFLDMNAFFAQPATS